MIHVVEGSGLCFRWIKPHSQCNMIVCYHKVSFAFCVSSNSVWLPLTFIVNRWHVI